MTTPAAQPGSPAPLEAVTLHTTRNGSGSDAAIIAALERIERRLARLESSVERVDSLARSAPALIATATDTFDRVAQRAAEAGIDVDERARTALTLLERLTAPEVAGPLTALLEHADTLRAAVDLLQQAPHLLATAMDAADGVASRLAVLSNLAKALPCDPSRTPKPVGPWRAYRALKEPDVQRALGFLLDVTRRLGACLSTQQLPAR